MWDTYHYNESSVCDDPISYQINSTVPSVCVPHPIKPNVYYQWICVAYTLYYEEYSTSRCNSTAINVIKYYSSCNHSVECSSFETYLDIGYNSDIINKIIGWMVGLFTAIIVAIVVGVVMVLCCVCCCCCKCSICSSWCCCSWFVCSCCTQHSFLPACCLMKSSTGPTSKTALLNVQVNETTTGTSATSIHDVPLLVGTSQTCLVASGDVVVQEIPSPNVGEGENDA